MPSVQECEFLQVFSFAPLLSVLIEGGSWLGVLQWTIKDWLLLVYAGAGVCAFLDPTQCR